MALFSERMGLTPAKALQRSEIDSSLRMRIWNVLTIYIWHLYEEDQYGDVGREGRMVDTLARSLWIHYLNRSWTGSRVAIALIVEQSVLRLSIEEAARATMRSNGPIGQFVGGELRGVRRLEQHRHHGQRGALDVKAVAGLRRRGEGHGWSSWKRARYPCGIKAQSVPWARGSLANGKKPGKPG